MGNFLFDGASVGASVGTKVGITLGPVVSGGHSHGRPADVTPVRPEVVDPVRSPVLEVE